MELIRNDDEIAQNERKIAGNRSKLVEIAVELLEQRGKCAKVDDRSEEEGCDVVRSAGGGQSWERRRTGLITYWLG